MCKQLLIAPCRPALNGLNLLEQSGRFTCRSICTNGATVGSVRLACPAFLFGVGFYVVEDRVFGGCKLIITSHQMHCPP